MDPALGGAGGVDGGGQGAVQVPVEEVEQVGHGVDRGGGAPRPGDDGPGHRLCQVDGGLGAGHLAHVAAEDVLLDGEVAAPEPLGEAGVDRDPVLLGGGEQLAAFVGEDGEGFLHQEGLAGLDGGHRRLEVGILGRGHDDGVHLRAIDDLARIHRVGVGLAGVGQALDPILDDVAHRQEVDRGMTVGDLSP